MPLSPFVAQPPAHVGYWKGGTDWPVIGGAGVPVSTQNIPYWNTTAAPGYGSKGSWHPTIGYMLVFIVGEMIAFHALSKYLNI